MEEKMRKSVIKCITMTKIQRLIDKFRKNGIIEMELFINNKTVPVAVLL